MPFVFLLAPAVINLGIQGIQSRVFYCKHIVRSIVIRRKYVRDHQHGVDEHIYIGACCIRTACAIISIKAGCKIAEIGIRICWIRNNRNVACAEAPYIIHRSGGSIRKVDYQRLLPC